MHWQPLRKNLYGHLCIIFIKNGNCLTQFGKYHHLSHHFRDFDPRRLNTSWPLIEAGLRRKKIYIYILWLRSAPLSHASGIYPKSWLKEVCFTVNLWRVQIHIFGPLETHKEDGECFAPPALVLIFGQAPSEPPALWAILKKKAETWI